MRFRGFGYKKIAKEMMLKRDTVRDYCRCHALTGWKEDFYPDIKKEMDEGKICANCGFPIDQPVRGKRMFCSNRCRYRYTKYQEQA